MSAVRNWLEAIGLAQYADAFEANDIDTDLLTQIDPGQRLASATNTASISALATLSVLSASLSHQQSRIPVVAPKRLTAC
jgi:hypothetical protein